MKQSCIFIICLILAFATVDTLNIKNMKNLMSPSDNHTENANQTDMANQTNKANQTGKDNHTEKDNHEEMANHTEKDMDKHEKEAMDAIYASVFSHESMAQEVIRTACMGTEDQADCAVYMCLNNFMARESKLCHMIMSEFDRQNPNQESEGNFEGYQEDPNKQVFLKTLKAKYDQSFYDDCDQGTSTTNSSEKFDLKQWNECIKNQCTKEEHKDQSECENIRKLRDCKAAEHKSFECMQIIRQEKRQEAESIVHERCGHASNWQECTKKVCTADSFETPSVMKDAYSCGWVAEEAKADKACARENEESRECRRRREHKEKVAAEDFVHELCRKHRETGFESNEEHEKAELCEKRSCKEYKEAKKSWTCEHYFTEERKDAHCALEEYIKTHECEERALHKKKEKAQHLIKDRCFKDDDYDARENCIREMCDGEASDAWICDRFKKHENHDRFKGFVKAQTLRKQMTKKRKMPRFKKRAQGTIKRRQK